MRPTIYLSNWSSHKTPGAHGPGRKFTIMARPREWEVGEGTVAVLMPRGVTVALMLCALANRGDTAAMGRYRDALTDDIERVRAYLVPDTLKAYASGPGTRDLLVADGDTLCCACSVAESRAGRCHRAWAAPFLHAAGWRVVLDGREWAPTPSAAP